MTQKYQEIRKSSRLGPVQELMTTDDKPIRIIHRMLFEHEAFRPLDVTRILRQLKLHWPVMTVFLLLMMIFAGSLQWQINGSGSDYAIDSGEMQIALNLWGTIHYTGYPQYTILSAFLTGLGRWLGMEPAAAASATSVVWSLMGLVLFYAILIRVVGAEWLAALVVLLLGVVETFWMHAVIAEVYAFSFLLLAAQIWLALSLLDEWRDRAWYGLVFLMGTAVSHHRLLVFALPGLMLLGWQRPSWRQRRFWFWSGFWFLLPFVAYLYLPLRAWGDGRWLYGDPGSWAGFWAQFFATEVPDFLFVRPASLADWLANGRTLAAGMQEQLPWSVWLAGLAGLVWLIRRRFWTGVVFSLTLLLFLGYAWVYPRAVWLPAVLLLPLLPLMAGLGFLLGQLSQRGKWVRIGLALILLAGAGGLLRKNYQVVTAVTQEQSSVVLLDRLRPLSQMKPPGPPQTLAVPWGTDYFAAAYGLYVTNELSGFSLVDHRADFDAIVRDEGQILTYDYNLGIWPYESWRQRWGEVYLSTAVPGIIAISPQMQNQNTANEANFALGNGVYIRRAELSWQNGSTLRLTLFWEARQPVPEPYRVAVHLVSQSPPIGPQDIVAQADVLNPVGGWYPVNLWSAGEVVRDDYALVVPAGMSPTAVRVAMYRQLADGAIENTNWFELTFDN